MSEQQPPIPQAQLLAKLSASYNDNRTYRTVLRRARAAAKRGKTRIVTSRQLSHHTIRRLEHEGFTVERRDFRWNDPRSPDVYEDRTEWVVLWPNLVTPLEELH